MLRCKTMLRYYGTKINTPGYLCMAESMYHFKDDSVGIAIFLDNISQASHLNKKNCTMWRLSWLIETKWHIFASES